MTGLVDTALTLVLLSVLFSFGSSRLPGLLKILAFQGLIVSAVPMFLEHQMSGGEMVFSCVTMLIRGVAIPLSIYLAIRKVGIRREVSPIVGYHVSILAGLVLIVAATFVSRELNVPVIGNYAMLLPTAITLLVGGMFLLMTRRNAIAMVLGYITMENGIYLVGTTFSVRAHHIVEFGILLDVLAGVMIMAIILRSINREFDDVDTSLLGSLKD